MAKLESTELSPDGLVEKVNEAVGELKAGQQARISIRDDNAYYRLAINGPDRFEGPLVPPMNPDAFYDFLKSKLNSNYFCGIPKYENDPLLTIKWAHIFIRPKIIPQAEISVDESQR